MDRGRRRAVPRSNSVPGRCRTPTFTSAHRIACAGQVLQLFTFENDGSWSRGARWTSAPHQHAAVPRRAAVRVHADTTCRSPRRDDARLRSLQRRLARQRRRVTCRATRLGSSAGTRLPAARASGRRATRADRSRGRDRRADRTRASRPPGSAVAATTSDPRRRPRAAAGSLWRSASVRDALAPTRSRGSIYGNDGAAATSTGSCGEIPRSRTLTFPPVRSRRLSCPRPPARLRHAGNSTMSSFMNVLSASTKPAPRDQRRAPYRAVVEALRPVAPVTVAATAAVGADPQ